MIVIVMRIGMMGMVKMADNGSDGGVDAGAGMVEMVMVGVVDNGDGGGGDGG